MFLVVMAIFGAQLTIAGAIVFLVYENQGESDKFGTRLRS